MMIAEQLKVLFIYPTDWRMIEVQVEVQSGIYDRWLRAISSRMSKGS
jgi:hypothetical protein